MTKMLAGACALLALAFTAGDAAAQQSRESMANDATATQWSFQLAYQGMLDYDQDTLSSGSVRPEGNKGFLQFRMVAPIPIKGGPTRGGVTILPRLTIRYTQNQQDEWGLSPTDLFALIVPLEWSWGRAGLGPDIVIPGREGFGSTEWQYGLATAAIMRAFNDKLTFGLLLQQVWGKQGSSDAVVAAPLNINPVIVLQLGKGVYIGNGDFVIRYNWQDQSWFVPVQVRLGKAFIQPGKTYNVYIEYGTSVVYDHWAPPVATHAVRVNFQFQLPI